ncbi:MAG: hypothetical protein JXA89_04265 [Anaerolineae bacterium]|nr:hypothetical protein [Anaerolineae bacterium]
MDISGDGQYLGFMEIGPYEKAQDNTADFVRRLEARSWSSFWIATADGVKVWKTHEEKRHLQHLLFHPTDPTTLIVCHESPWDRIEQRMWLIKWDGSSVTMPSMWRCSTCRAAPSHRSCDTTRN